MKTKFTFARVKVSTTTMTTEQRNQVQSSWKIKRSCSELIEEENELWRLNSRHYAMDGSIYILANGQGQTCGKQSEGGWVWGEGQ